MELFAKNLFSAVNYCQKRFILDVELGSEYASGMTF